MFSTSHVVLTCTMLVSLSLPTVRFYSSGHFAIPRTRRVSIAAAFRPEVWRRRRIAPTREGPRNESSNRARESTSGRSTHYASGHLIRVFRGIGHIFSSPYPFHWRSCSLVALAAVRDLFICAKHLFVAAIADGDAARLAAVRSAAQLR
jgi:hypothetical protein